MAFRELLVPLALVSLVVVLLVGCKSGGTQPSNPFAKNSQTVPPPATFSSQESFLGQAPGAGTFAPQPPASTFQPSGTVMPTQPTTSPSASIPFSDATNTNAGEQGAMLFAAPTKGTSTNAGWEPIVVTSTSQTAFQVLEEKNKAVPASGIATNASESLVVGTSPIVTAIVDESAPATTLSEPQILYSGKYAE